MAHTEFKYGVPYNTIRLGADVAQWMQHGQSYLDYSSFKPTGQVSMGQLQAIATSTPNVDPTGSGNYPGYPAVGRKWGIGNATDQNTGAGILMGQAGGTSDWVGTRNYNFASNPQNIRLSYLSGLDYTAVMELEDRQANIGSNERDSFVILDEDATDRYWCTTQPVEMFTDEPLFVAAVRDTPANRNLYVIRTGVLGDKFSDINDENWIKVSNPDDTNDILHLSAIRENLGSTYSSNQPAFVATGRRTSSSSNVRVTLYLYNKGTNGLSPTVTKGAQINVNSGFSNNAISNGLCYIADNRVMMQISRGAQGTKVVGLSYGSGWTAGTVTSLGGGNGFGALRGGMASLRDEYNPSGQDGEAIVVWAANKSTYNSNIYAQRVRQNGTTLTLSTQRTLITDTNDIKSCNACLLATDNTNAWIGVVRSDSAGDAIISVHKYSYGGDSFTEVGNFKHDYNDTSLNNIISITPMGRNYKNQNTFVGETFQPGQSNNYDRIVWFKVLLATNQDTDDVSEVHGYVNLDGTGTQVFELLTSNISTGRNSWTQKSDFNTDGRKWCKGQYPLAGGENWVMTTAAYYSTSPTNDYAAATYVNGLDRLYDWNVFHVDLTSGKTPPGPTGSDYVISTNVGAQPGPNNPSGGYVYGRWNVGPSNGKLNQNSFLSSSNYMTVEYYKKGEGFFYGSFGSGTQMMGFDDTDIDGNRWGTYWGQLKSYVEGGNNVNMRVFDQNNSSSLFTISSTIGSGPTYRGEDEIKILDGDNLVIRWTSGGNGFSGNNFTLWEGPSVNQVKVGFQYVP